MAMADAVPLYLTILMAVLIIIALAGKGDKGNGKTSSDDIKNSKDDSE